MDMMIQPSLDKAEYEASQTVETVVEKVVPKQLQVLQDVTTAQERLELSESDAVSKGDESELFDESSRVDTADQEPISGNVTDVSRRKSRYESARKQRNGSFDYTGDRSSTCSTPEQVIDTIKLQTGKQRQTILSRTGLVLEVLENVRDPIASEYRGLLPASTHDPTAVSSLYLMHLGSSIRSTSRSTGPKRNKQMATKEISKFNKDRPATRKIKRITNIVQEYKTVAAIP
jgi:hypothetical protein